MAEILKAEKSLNKTLPVAAPLPTTESVWG